MQIKKQQLEPDMEPQTGSKLGQEYVKAVYCHPTYLTYVQSSVQFSSVIQSCPTLYDPMDCSTPGFPVLHHLPEFAQTHVHRVGDAIPTISSSDIPFSSHFQLFPASGSLQMSQFFASGGQSIGVSSSTSVLPMNIRD